jgi:hypothetical protein
MASQDTEEDTDREEYRADGLDVSSFSDGGTDRSDDVATRASSAHESDRSRVKAPSDRTVSRDITSDWVTERLARIAEISLGD